MAAMIKYFLTILLFNFASKGYCQCSFRNIGIGAAASGREIQGKREWIVAVVNKCNCTQSGITVACAGFQSVEKVDPKLFIKAADSCLVDEGRPLAPFANIQFSYAWEPPFLLAPQSSIVQC